MVAPIYELPSNISTMLFLGNFCFLLRKDEISFYDIKFREKKRRKKYIHIYIPGFLQWSILKAEKYNVLFLVVRLLREGEGGEVMAGPLEKITFFEARTKKFPKIKLEWLGLVIWPLKKDDFFQLPYVKKEISWILKCLFSGYLAKRTKPLPTVSIRYNHKKKPLKRWYMYKNYNKFAMLRRVAHSVKNSFLPTIWHLFCFHKKP